MKSHESILPIMIGYLGFIVMFAGGVVLLPLIIIPFYHQDLSELLCFLIPGLLSIFIGFILSMHLFRKKEHGHLRQHQEAVVVIIAWMVVITISAIPWLISGKYNFAQAVFEMTSGYTTTGLTVVNVAETPHIFLFYRSLTMFFGGVGLLLVLMSILNLPHGMRIFNAEGHRDRLYPNLLDTARVVFTIYTGYIIGGATIYRILGMNWFDSINHSISAFATGGFSTRPESIAFYNSVAIDIATMVFMLLGSITFAVHLCLFRGKIKPFFKHCEMKLTFLMIAFCTPFIAYFGMHAAGLSLPQSIRYTVFDIISVFSTTGYYAGPDLYAFTMPAVLLFIILMLIGGQSGSTAGGIKQYRIVLGVKSLWWQLRDYFFNKKVICANMITNIDRRESVSDKEATNCLVFIFIYMIIIFVGTLIFTTQGYNIQDSLFEFASAMGNIGYSVGITSRSANALTLWTGTLGMLLGRLEIIVVFMGIGSLINSVKRRLA